MAGAERLSAGAEGVLSTLQEWDRAMNVNDALSKIHAPKGFTTVMSAALTGNFDPIRGQDAVGTSIDAAKAKLESVMKAQVECGSDWAFWGYEGDRAYWSAVVDILEAAKLVGAANLPDIAAPKLDGLIVMDACYKVEEFGRAVLKEAKAND